MKVKLVTRGSEWRKWDLHLHAPGTKLNDQFNSDNDTIWDEYCRRLNHSDVQAFGITDYFSADTYLSVCREFRERYPQSVKIFLPNIELRTNDVVNHADEEVNVHLIFNPFSTDHKVKVGSFLRSLQTNKTDTNGRNVRASELTHVAHFEEATTTRSFIREALEDTYGKNVELLDHVMIVTAANNDGIRPMRGKRRKLAITDELDKFSHAFFGNAGNREYFLGSGRLEDKKQIPSPKPVLSGCDAHSLKDMDLRLGQVVSHSSDGIVLEPTWIKADLTFEGLKQIVFEPVNRVFIGEEPEIERRVREHSTRYIKALHVSCIDSYRGQHGVWFKDTKIPFGKELVAIIGNKGSGKSAITDILGLLGNSHKQRAPHPGRGDEELFSFLNRDKFLKRKCADNFAGSLHWHGGEADQRLLGDRVAGNLSEKVEYLPQKYLERLCANIADDEFRTTLNKVIFRYVKPQHSHGQTDLESLIAYLTHQADEEIEQWKHNLHSANVRVVATEKKLTASYKQEIEEKLRLKRQELTEHEINRPQEPPKPAATDIDSPSKESREIEALSRRIESDTNTIGTLEIEQIEKSRIAQQLQHLKEAIDRTAGSLTKIGLQYKDLFDAVELAFEDVVRLSVDYSALERPIGQNKKRTEEIETLLATEDDINERFLFEPDAENAMEKAKNASVICRRAQLQQQKMKLVKQQAKPVQEYQAYLGKLQTWTARRDAILGDAKNPEPESVGGLRREMAYISQIYPQELVQARGEQLGLSKEVFLRKRRLKRYYGEIKHSIDREIEKSRADLGNYSISIEAALRFDPSFLDRFLSFINQGKRGSFHGIEDGKGMLQGFCDAVDDWEIEDQVFDALNEIVEALHIDKRSNVYDAQDRQRNVFEQMRGLESSLVELYDHLFGFNYLNIKYDLKVDQKDLSELSPGERGGLLLIFYLMLDKRRIPLVIDQPEDNLDNKSVYEMLVTFIKKAKTHRQIILVTHNPNLAVVADAEQIIHVSIDKEIGKNEFGFFSGSIENSKVNSAVVDILEGTLPAFDNRRLKYRRKNEA